VQALIFKPRQTEFARLKSDFSVTLLIFENWQLEGKILKYLQKAPFTIPVSSRNMNKPKIRTEKDEREQKRRTSTPHVYLNGGSMCLVCGLGEKAKIHEV
jgi:hypothetical protein